MTLSARAAQKRQTGQSEFRLGGFAKCENRLGDTRERLDGNKKVTGRKRFILIDTLGLAPGILSVAANVGERKGAERLFHAAHRKYPRLQKVLADQGFDGVTYAAHSELLFILNSDNK